MEIFNIKIADRVVGISALFEQTRLFCRDYITEETPDFSVVIMPEAAWTAYNGMDIHSVWRGTNPMGQAEEENHAYALEGTTLAAVDCMIGESEHTIYFYDIAKANTAENVDAIIW